jgi:hypothetical protein
MPESKPMITTIQATPGWYVAMFIPGCHSDTKEDQILQIAAIKTDDDLKDHAAAPPSSVMNSRRSIFAVIR